MGQVCALVHPCVATEHACACVCECVCIFVRTRCVGGVGVSVVCRLLAEDYGGARGGMPDLTLWRPHRGDARLVEGRWKVGRRWGEGMGKTFWDRFGDGAEAT